MKSKKLNLYDVIVGAIIVTFSLFCLLPLLLVLSISFSEERALLFGGFSLWPAEFSAEAYRLIFRNATILNSYIVTIFITVVGTIVAMIMTLGAAFLLSNKQVYYRNQLAFFFFFTMLFSGGIVPWFLINNALGLRDNLGALIIPSLLFTPFNMFLVRNFMNGIPDTLMEAAKIDGAGDVNIAVKIYFPLCLPVIAAVSLFYAIAYWNDWWNAIMLVDRRDLFPLQFFLFRLQSEIQLLRDIQITAGGTAGAVQNLPGESLRMATAIVTIGPIIFLYPFLQKYFVKGLIIGSVKG